MFGYLGTVVTVAAVRVSGMFNISNDKWDWNWIPEWVDEIVDDVKETPSPMTLQLDMYEQFREKGYFFCIADNPSNSPKAGWWVIQVGNINRQGKYKCFEKRTLQDAWDEVVVWCTSVESF